VRAVVAVVTISLLVSCGGSSSETPPPLEPDPEALAGRKPAEASEAAKPAAEQSSGQSEGREASPFGIEPRYPGTTEAEPKRSRPVQTWGGNRPTPPPELAPAPE
jgi:hypothetical protein